MAVRLSTKKKSVSCPAGDQNCGQSGGRFFLLFLDWKILSIFGKPFFLAKLKKKEKRSPVAPVLVTRPLNRKHTYF